MSPAGPLVPIPTTFAGVAFRSRLEADWAHHLTTLGIPWSYEPDGVTLPGGRRYLPDFWLPEASAWVEVKGPGVPGLDKVDALRDALLVPGPEGFLGELGQAVVIARPARGERASFSVACRYCGGWLDPDPNEGAAIEVCYAGHRGFVTRHGGPGGCGMDSRCWKCGEKTRLIPHLDAGVFRRVPR